MESFATIEELQELWRPLQLHEKERAEKLLPVVSDCLREEAKKVNKDLDELAKESVTYTSVLKSVTIDVVARTLMTSTNQEPMSQYSESALGYSVSGSFLVPGGGLFIKRDELARLGLKKQKIGVVSFHAGN